MGELASVDDTRAFVRAIVPEGAPLGGPRAGEPARTELPQREASPMLSAHITSFLKLIGAQLEETSRGIRSIHHFAPCIGKQRCYRPAVDFFIELVDALGRGKVRLDRYPLFHLRAEVDPPRFRAPIDGGNQQIKFVLGALPGQLEPDSGRSASDDCKFALRLGIGCLLHARLQYDLDAAVLLVTECLVSSGPFSQDGEKAFYQAEEEKREFNLQKKKGGARPVPQRSNTQVPGSIT